jgi:Zn-dependent protease
VAAVVQLAMMAALGGAGSWWLDRPAPWLDAGLVALVVAGTAVAHEAGHAVAAWAGGLRVLRVEFTGAFRAAVVRTVGRGRPGARVELAACLAGPAVSLILLGLGLVLHGGGSAPVVGPALVVANLIAVCGSLPVHPDTDGARAIRARRALRDLAREPEEHPS